MVGPAKIDTNQIDRIQREIEAGLVFAAAASEYRTEDPTRARMCRAEAEDCYATALDLLREAGFPGGCPELDSVLAELKQHLNSFRGARLARAASAA